MVVRCLTSGAAEGLCSHEYMDLTRRLETGRPFVQVIWVKHALL